MRELGLVTIFWDVNFTNVGKLFDAGGKLLDDSFHHRIDKFLKELIWMSKRCVTGGSKLNLTEHGGAQWQREKKSCVPDAVLP